MEDGGETGELIPSDPAFWDHFYGPEGEASGDVFEWYLSFEHARQCYERFLSADSMVLQVGCGTSTLAHDLINCNLARHVVSIDTCAPAIEQMQALSAPQQRPATNKKPSHGRGRGKRKGGGQSAAPEPAGAAGIPLTIDGSVVMLKPEGASYYLMDACALGFPAESFDAVVDKGTLDAMLSIGDEADSCCWQMLEEIARVLKPDGLYLVVSGPKIKGEPDWMLEVFHKCGLWDMDNAIHSPVQVPLNTGGAGDGRDDQPVDSVGPNKKEYFITYKECERVIMEALLGAFPTHRFIGEETAVDGTDDVLTDTPTWIIDPLDGTINFVHKFPYICVCIGLVVNKKPLVGVVYAPLLDEMFTAISGQGAFLNDRRIRVSQIRELESAMLATGFPKYREYLNFQTAAIYQALSSNVQAIRANGSCALDMCGVAVGRLEAYYTCTGVRTWDFAAATVIVREAGGLVLDPTGGELDIMGKRVMATNGQEMADKIVGFIRDRNLPQDVGSLPDF